MPICLNIQGKYGVLHCYVMLWIRIWTLDKSNSDNANTYLPISQIRASYMSACVSLNSLNKLGESDKMQCFVFSYLEKYKRPCSLG